MVRREFDMDQSRRFGPKLAALQANPKTYLSDPCHAEYAAFRASFTAAEKTAEIAELLEVVPAINDIHQELVPEKVPYIDFWSRYFFQAGPIAEEEARKKKLLTSAELFDDDENFMWDEDESPNSPNPIAEKGIDAAAPNHTVAGEQVPAKEETEEKTENDGVREKAIDAEEVALVPKPAGTETASAQQKEAIHSEIRTSPAADAAAPAPEAATVKKNNDQEAGEARESAQAKAQEHESSNKSAHAQPAQANQQADAAAAAAASAAAEGGEALLGSSGSSGEGSGSSVVVVSSGSSATGSAASLVLSAAAKTVSSVAAAQNDDWAEWE